MSPVGREIRDLIARENELKARAKRAASYAEQLALVTEARRVRSEWERLDRQERQRKALQKVKVAA